MIKNISIAICIFFLTNFLNYISNNSKNLSSRPFEDHGIRSLELVLISATTKYTSKIHIFLTIITCLYPKHFSFTSLTLAGCLKNRVHHFEHPVYTMTRARRATIFGNSLRLTMNARLAAKRVEIVSAKRAFDPTCCTSERVN